VDTDTFYIFDETWDQTLRVERVNSSYVKVTDIETDIGSSRSCWDVAWRLANKEFTLVDQYQSAMRDNTRIGSLNERPLSYHALLPDHWNLLHPNGSYIATMVAAAFGYSYVASVNDFTGIEFRYVGERFQRLKDRIGTKQRCDVCAMIVPLDSEEHRLCPTCAEVEARRKEVLSWK
jgi:hypothetical protein